MAGGEPDGLLDRLCESAKNKRPVSKTPTGYFSLYRLRNKTRGVLSGGGDLCGQKPAGGELATEEARMTLATR
jgi:hypothetical protein